MEIYRKDQRHIHIDNNNNKKKFLVFSFKTILSYGCLLAIIFLFVINAYFEKINLNDVFSGTSLNEYKFIDESKNVSIIESCQPFNTSVKIFNISIDGHIYPKYVPFYFNPQVNYECLRRNTRSKVILLWNTWFGVVDFNYGIGKRKPFEENNCPVSDCEITNDRTRFNESDMIVFHMRDSIDELPALRYSHQRWIFLLYESPVHSPKFERYNNLFNLSATYRLDSDFTTFYYSKYTWEENHDFDDTLDFTKHKTEFAAIVVSNCDTRNKRLSFVKKLQQHISVTVYGKCGKPCPKAYDDGREAYCKEILAYKYKFYFAFENSICKDYITEKFFDILYYNIIPVVYGGGNYEKYVPKSGYINAFDFDTPKHLAEYLLYLDSNKTAYNSYFKWKKWIKFKHNVPRIGHFCEMCMHLHLESFESIRHNVIGDMNQFWNAKQDCKSVDEKTFRPI